MQTNQIKIRSSLKVPYRKIVIEYLNVIFGSGQDAHHWWRQRVPLHLAKYFAVEWYPFPSITTDEGQDWRGTVYSFNSKRGREFLFEQIGNLIFIIFPYFICHFFLNPLCFNFFSFHIFLHFL
jgi:hypothetical protein